MSICDQGIDFDEFKNRLVKLNENIGRFLVGGALNLQSTIEQLALIKRIKTDFEDFQTVLVEQLTITLICKTLEAYNETDLANEVQAQAEQFFQLFEDFESQIDAIPDSTDFNQLEAAVDGVLNQYEPLIEEKRQMIRDKAREMLSLLFYIGVPESDIDAALEEVEFEDDPRQYVIDLFNNLVDKADLRL